MQVGAQCTDGQGSTGAAVPDVPPPAPAQPATPSPPAPGPLPPLPELAPPPAPPPPAELPQTSAPSPPHSDRVPGAAVGASVRGLAGAKWADPKNSGFVTGYTYRGRYHPGAPAGYDPTTATVLDRRAAPGKLFPPPPSAIVGGRIRGEPGAVWADLNNDGVADGYVEDGRYFPGVPPGFASGAEAMPPPPPPGTFTAPPVTSSGERG